jgi:ABC-type transport system involved in multi-copper enzyme maturation permease subunit
VFTVTGSGDVGPFKFGDDIARMSLSGVFAGLMALVALGVLSITSEYKRGMIRSTFTAGPRRGRVLAAKAVVLGASTFVAGLVASFGAFLLANPILDSHGFTAPSLSDGPVLRALVGTAALMAVVAVLALGVGAILRHSAGAITVVVLLLFIPQILASGLPLSAALCLGRITPAAGFAIQQTVERYDSAISP